MRARIFLVFVLLAAVSLSAQTFRGTILGTVTDRLRRSDSRGQGDRKEHRHRTRAHHRDQRRRQLLSAGAPHRLLYGDVTQPGFQTFIATGVTVDVGDGTSRRCALKTGEVRLRWKSQAISCPRSRRPPLNSAELDRRHD